MQGMKRRCEQLIHEYLGFFPAVVLMGARQTGKSTLLAAVSDERPIFDLELAADYQQVVDDPDLFLRLEAGPIAIDEAQVAPQLFPALRVAIDRDRTHYGKYLLTGSSSPELVSSISESLAGRVGIIEIAPFALSEVLGVRQPWLLDLLQGDNDIESIRSLPPPEEHREFRSICDDYWLHGGYPEPWLRSDQRFRSAWREQYLKTYIERDVGRLFPNLSSVRFRRFVELLAACSGDIINYSKLAGILDVSQPTAKDYFRIAHGTFVWRTLPAFSRNASKRVTRHPRGYLRDCGLLHHILQIPSLRRLKAHPIMSASWEGMVIEEILRTLNADGVQYQAYYYRTSAGAEVDLVLEGAFGLVPFEIKHAAAIGVRQLRAIRDFIEEFNCPFGIVVNNDEKIRYYDEKLIGIPLSYLIGESRS